MHNVDYGVIYHAVLKDLQTHAVLAVNDEKKLVDEILKANDVSNIRSIQRYEKSIRESNNRIDEIDGLLQNMYEDKVAGDITADVFRRMSQKYSEEQAQLIVEVEQLETKFAECHRVDSNLTGWTKRIKECLTIDSLTRAIVVELIDRIDVSEVYNADGEKNLDIAISYRFGLQADKNKLEQKNRAS